MKMSISVLAAMIATLSAAPSIACDIPEVKAEAQKVLDERERAGAVITQAVRDDLLSKSCEAADDLVKQNLATAPAIAAKLPTVLTKHLEGQLDVGANAQTIGALLRKEFGASGLSRPALRSYGTVTVMYEATIDWVEILGEKFNPARETFLVPAGSVSLKGYVGSTQVCGGAGSVAAAKTELIKCAKP